MYIATIRQDYYPAPPPSVSARGGAGVRQHSGAATTAGVLPTERVMEGEWQKRSGAAGDSVFERVWRQRAGDTAQNPLPSEARRAISAYRDQASFFDRRAVTSVSRIDYYA